MLYEHGYNRVVLDRRQCAGASPAVPELCSGSLCPLYSASSSSASYCTQQCRGLCNTPLGAGPLYVSVWNTGTSGPSLLPLSYSLAATCSAALPCPAPLPAVGACAGVGTCMAATGSATAMPACACTGGPDAGSVWGDVGCDKPLRLLTPGVPLLNQTLPYGQWAYYTFAATAGLPLQLQLNRGGGDPLLLLKNASSPPVPYGVPSLEDYYSSADTVSFTAAGNTAYRMLTSVTAAQAGAPGRLIAAVYANNRYQVDSVYDLLLSQAPEAACPLSCNGAGACVAGRCVCADGFGGAACEGRMVSLSSTGGKIGPFTLAAGAWVYISVRTGKSTSLQLKHSGTHPLLLARASALPTLDTYDWPLSSSGNPIADSLVSDADSAWQPPLGAGELWYFALYAYPSRAHNVAPCVFEFGITTSASSSGSFSSGSLSPAASPAFVLVVATLLIIAAQF